MSDEFAFRLAVFLKTDPLSLPKQERLRESERLLLMLSHRFPTSGTIDVELADLYYQCGRYASALGHLLRAKLNGHPVDPDVVTAYHKRLLKESVDLSEDSHGGFILGTALVDFGLLEKGTALIEQAIATSRDKPWAGCAALVLADAYRGHNEGLRIKYLKLASELGNPEILTPCKPTKSIF